MKINHNIINDKNVTATVNNYSSKLLTPTRCKLDYYTICFQ